MHQFILFCSLTQLHPTVLLFLVQARFNPSKFRILTSASRDFEQIKLGMEILGEIFCRDLRKAKKIFFLLVVVKKACNHALCIILGWVIIVLDTLYFIKGDCVKYRWGTKSYKKQNVND